MMNDPGSEKVCGQGLAPTHAKRSHITQIHLYRERETDIDIDRDRERQADTDTGIKRHRHTERERERNRESERPLVPRLSALLRHGRDVATLLKTKTCQVSSLLHQTRGRLRWFQAP